MGNKWTTASALKEFLRREQDIIDSHRMQADYMADENQLMQEVTQNSMQGMPDQDMMPEQSVQIAGY